MKKETVISLLKRPQLIKYLFVKKYPWLISDDRKYIEFIWKYRMTYPLNLDNPQTYNEKLQWLKLYDRKPLYTTLVDKYVVKEYVSSLIGEKYIIPTYGVWDKFDDIDFHSLPDQFVLKCTHDSGGLVICKDKNLLDKKKAKNKIEKSLKRKFWLDAREWPYKNVKPRIIAEQYMEGESGGLDDYKFFCFNGEPKLMFVATERQSREEPYFDFYDMDFNHLNMRHGHPNAPNPPQKPTQFELMKELSMVLSKGFPTIRVDFYEAHGRVYFGELTFYHHTGMVEFEPREWDKKIGDYIQLNSLK